MDTKSRTRIPIAPKSPTRRARPWGDDGSLLDRIEMKITLSTPSTISRNVSVMSAIRPEEVKNASMRPLSLGAELYIIPDQVLCRAGPPPINLESVQTRRGHSGSSLCLRQCVCRRRQVEPVVLTSPRSPRFFVGNQPSVLDFEAGRESVLCGGYQYPLSRRGMRKEQLAESTRERPSFQADCNRPKKLQN